MTIYYITIIYGTLNTLSWISIFGF